jgi:serine protease Do
MKYLKNTFRVAVLCSATLLTLTLALPAFGQPFRDRPITPPRSDSQFLYAFRDATAEATKSTVRVLADKKEVALGTVVGEDGWILTKYSELPPGKAVSCKLRDGKTLDAKLVGIKDDCDLAMLKVEAKGLAPVKFTESKVAPVGNWLASPGMSDDPVAVGVMSVASRNLGAADARSSKRGFLGIQMEKAEGAIKITVVTRRTAAEKAGLKVDDLILSVNGKKVDSLEKMQEIMSKTKVDEVITLKIKRGDEEKELKATLGKVPADRADMQNSMGTDLVPLSERRTGFPTFFQHDSLVPAKECGGPICDLDGHVLGINIARAGRTETFAIPSEVITPLLADLESGKLAPNLMAVLEDLRAAVKKAEEEKAAAEKKLAQAKEAQIEAEKRLKEAKEALEKAEKEAKERK